MKKDFIIKHTSVEIIDNNHRVYDIHNSYKFNGIVLEAATESCVKIFFEKMEGEWIKESDPGEIAFVFLDVKYLEFSKLFFIERPSTIDELGYKAPTDRDYDWLLSEDHFSGDEHFIFRFLYGEYIRVFADRVELFIVH